MGVVGTVRRYTAEMGPAWVAGAIAAGPATMASLLTAGARFDYALLWIAVLSAVLGATSQYLAMRLGVLTGEGIVAVVEEYLGSGWAWLLVIDTVLASGLAQLVIMKTVAGVSATVAGDALGTAANPTLWAVFWAVVLAVGLVGGGYRIAEFGAKLLVSLAVVAFVASLFVVPIDVGAAASGLVPRIPAGLDGAVVAAGILGGAVHVTLITMHSYNLKARGWTRENYGLATFDVGASMLVAFGVYSLAIFLVAASVLSDPSLGTVGAAAALEPVAGANAKWLFLAGLLGAAVSTLGANAVVAPYLLADKLGWETDVSDSRYRAALLVTTLAGVGGVLVGGNVFSLLTATLAFGLVGTPFALALVLYLLNSEAVPEPNPTLANVGGVVLIAITTVVAASSLREQVASGVDAVTGFVLLFAAVLGAATLALLGLTVRERLRGEPAPASAAD